MKNVKRYRSRTSVDSEHPTAPEQVLFYQAEDGSSRIEVRLEQGTVWLSQAAMAELFQTTPQNITLHLKNIYEEGELLLKATCKDRLQVQKEGSRDVGRNRKLYNLDAVIAVGYRVKSIRGTQFRKWATERLREYVVKGFTMDDERLKRAGGGAYFEELLARIRDIRSSEKVFWRKVLEIYATSIDYDPSAETSQRFFAVVQNKMHWAVHGHTAAEIISERADSSRPHMGLTSWSGTRPMRTDIEIAKNYLNAEEMDALNRIVTAYLEFAEIQAMNHKPMYMHDWVLKLDDFLRLSGRDLLEHAGKVSHDRAITHAGREYEKYQALHVNGLSPVEEHFMAAVTKIKQLEHARPRKRVSKKD